MRASRPRDWWREVKQLCGCTKATERNLNSKLHKDFVCEDVVLAEKIYQAFVSVMKDYSPLADSARVSADDDVPIVITEQGSFARSALFMRVAQTTFQTGSSRNVLISWQRPLLT